MMRLIIRYATGAVRRSVFVDLLLLAAIEAFMMVFLDVRYLFYNTVVTGGDTASWHGMANHLLTELLPRGRLTGWDMGNFCGYPNFSYYFLPPFLLAALPSYVLHLPLTITLKLAIASGIFLFPVMTYLGLRSMGYRFPGPVIGAAASLLLLFDEHYTMFGGNVLSTNTGEFSYMLAFALFAYFIGSLPRGVELERGAVRNGVLLALIGLSHLFVFIPAICLVVYLLLARGRLWYLAKVSILAFGIMAFWALPLVAYRHPYTTPVYMIWQDFVSWRHAFMGIGMVLLFLGPRLALAVLGEIRRLSPRRLWGWVFIGAASLGAFTLAYVGGTYLVLGPGLFDHGLHISPLSASPIGASSASIMSPWIIPFGIVSALAALALGIRALGSTPHLERYCYTAGALFFTFGVLFASITFHVLLGRSVTNPGLRSFVLSTPAMVVTHGIICLGMVFLLFFRKSFKDLTLSVAPEVLPARFGAFLGLGFGCVVWYFAAHYLEVPDIRFLPPLVFVLLLVLFADTLEPFLSRIPPAKRTSAAMMITYGCILVVIFGASRADRWFRYNNRGYEYTMGSFDFQRANLYLKHAYGSFQNDPLNAPRVGYEKCGLYGPYGGDRVFESLPFFAGRQTMEGIHYASSIASRFVAFLQTAYSKEIKTPRAYILSRLNASALPAYFDLYNISQLILMTNEAKKEVERSPFFTKEAVFGEISVYRYRNCDGRYVDVPRRRPLLYTGKNWVEDFYRWYRQGQNLDLLMVPRAFVEDPGDRGVFGPETGSVDLSQFQSDPLDRQDLQIATRIEHQKISFTTNKVGVPHLIKVSYYPNWKVEGARAVYPVSPHLMMVIPRETHVVLTYGKNPWDCVGQWITWITLFLLFLRGGWLLTSRRLPENHAIREWIRYSSAFPVSRVVNPAERAFGYARPFLIGITLLSASALIAGGALNRNKPVRAYIEGYRLYKTGMDLKQRGEERNSRFYFEEAFKTMSPIFEGTYTYDHQDVILCMLFAAAAQENLEQWANAETIYRRILKEYPFSRYVGEAYVKIGRVKKREGKIRQALEYFEKAIREDPHSVWAEYARDDIKKLGS